MANKRVRTYDPELTTIQLGSMFLTGFAEDGKIEVEKNEDNHIAKVGVDGVVSRTKNHDKTATAKITLMNTSPCLPAIYDLAKGYQIFPFSLVDMNDNGRNISCNECWIVKEPTSKVGKEADSVEFEVYIPEV